MLLPKKIRNLFLISYWVSHGYSVSAVECYEDSKQILNDPVPYATRGVDSLVLGEAQGSICALDYTEIEAEDAAKYLRKNLDRNMPDLRYLLDDLAERFPKTSSSINCVTVDVGTKDLKLYLGNRVAELQKKKRYPYWQLMEIAIQASAYYEAVESAGIVAPLRQRQFADLISKIAGFHSSEEGALLLWSFDNYDLEDFVLARAANLFLVNVTDTTRYVDGRVTSPLAFVAHDLNHASDSLYRLQLAKKEVRPVKLQDWQNSPELRTVTISKWNTKAGQARSWLALAEKEPLATALAIKATYFMTVHEDLSCKFASFKHHVLDFRQISATFASECTTWEWADKIVDFFSLASRRGFHDIGRQDIGLIRSRAGIFADLGADPWADFRSAVDWAKAYGG